MTNRDQKNKKMLIFHAFLSTWGGAEVVVIEMRNYFKADLLVGGLRNEVFNKESQNHISKQIFDPNYNFDYLHLDSKIPIIRHVKRQLAFILSPKINNINNYDIVIFTGNIFWVALRLRLMKTKTKLVYYCHTPPRLFTDQKEQIKSKLLFFVRPFYEIFSQIVVYFFKSELKKMDLLITNSHNTHDRVKKYLNLESLPIFPPIDTNKFKYISDGDFFLSHSRLENAKRIRLIVEAFKKRPDLKLVICSTGPLKDWLVNEIKTKNLKNIEYKGLVSQKELENLVGTCLAGIVIPVDEDAGMVQIEVMAAGKPVLGVKEGGLLETVTSKTGYLINSNPTVEDVIRGADYIKNNAAKFKKEDCISQALIFDKSVFFDKFQQSIERL